MQTILYLELNGFALVVLLLIFLNVRHQKGKYLLEQKLFLALLLSNALILILDSAMWLLDGRKGFFIRGIYLLVTVVYYSLNPVISMIWSLYVDYLICRDESRLRRMFGWMMVPVCVNAALSFMGIWGNFLFNIDGNNVYHRGKLFYMMAAISYLYLIYTLLFIIVKQKQMKDEKKGYHAIPILAFAVPPFIGGILQTLFYGVSLIWVSMTISILIIFINFQNYQLYTDHLTGLFNRRQLDNYLQGRLRSGSGGNLIGGIMIDLDSFKEINDIYGHNAGDQALEYSAKIFMNTFRRNDFIARYGGDEFIIIMELEDSGDLMRAIERLKENIRQFNLRTVVPYKIGLSMGYDLFDCRSGKSVTDFLKHIDGLMYRDKLNNRGLKHA